MAENGFGDEPADGDRSDGGVPFWTRIKEIFLQAFVAWTASVLLAVAVILLMFRFVTPRDWNAFWSGVIAEIVGAVAVGFALTPAFLAIRAFANDRLGPRDFERFPYSEFVARLVKCDDLVRIMDTYSSVIDPAVANTDEEREQRKRCVDSLRAVLRKRKNVDIEVLLLNPTSDAARQRSTDLKDQGIDIGMGVGRNLALLNRMRSELPPGSRRRLIVRLYDSTPVCAYYRVDERTSIAFFALQRPTEQGAHIDVALKSVLGKIVNDHFREIRDHSMSVDFVTYLYGTVTVGERHERVGWIEVPDPAAGPDVPPRLYLAVNAKENPATWRAAPNVGEAVRLTFHAYKRETAEFFASELRLWSEEPELARAARAKYGVEFDFFFALEPVPAAADPAAGGPALPAQGSGPDGAVPAPAAE